MTSWTSEMVIRLKKLWDDGLSAREIAVELKAPSRNSVLGAANRHGLPTRRRVKKRDKNTTESPPLPRKPIVRPSTQATVPPELIETVTGGITIDALVNDSCRAIVGLQQRPNGSGDEALYCGVTQVPDKSWCPKHFAIYTVPRSR